MMKTSDLGYIIKRVIIGVLIGLILFNLKSCTVYADECNSGTPTLSYKDTDGVWHDIQNTNIGQTYNVTQDTNFIGKYNVSTIGTNHFSFSYSLEYTTDGNFTSYIPSVTVSYGSSTFTNISSSCTRYGTSICTERFEGFCVETKSSVFGYCEYDSTSTTANQVRVQVWTGLENTTTPMSIKFNQACFVKTPSVADEVNLNSDNNTSYLKNFMGETINDLRSTLLFSNSSLGQSLSNQNTGLSTQLMLIGSDITNLSSDIVSNQKVCQQINNINEVDGKYFYSGGSYGTNENFFITQYIDIYQSTIKVISRGNAYYSCYYSRTKDLISCTDNALYQNGDYMIAPDNAYYLRLSVRKSNNTPTIEICKNGNQSLFDEINDIFRNDETSGDIGIINNQLCTLGGCIDISQLGLLSTLLTLPQNIYTSIHTVLDDTSFDGLRIDKNDLPFYSKGIYRHVTFHSGAYVVPSLRNIVFNFSGNLANRVDEWYESMGTIAGVLLLLVYLVKKGKKIMSMGRLGSDDSSAWGGIA